MLHELQHSRDRQGVVEVFEELGYEVAVPEQKCSGTPMFANGVLDDAEAAAKFNVEKLAKLIEQGYNVVCTCASCSLRIEAGLPGSFQFQGL